MTIKAIYRKNLKMSEGKIASQVAHAIAKLSNRYWLFQPERIIVLGVSDKKFTELIKDHRYFAIQTDLGLTETQPGTQTAAAWEEE